MDYVLAVFVNRTHSQMFSKNLYRYGINNKLVSTPRELASSCGLSVKFNIKGINVAKNIIKNNNYLSYLGIYKIVPLSINKISYIKL